MPLIIKNRSVIEDTWTLLGADASLEEALQNEKAIVPFSLWQAERETLLKKMHRAVWLESNEIIEDLADDLDQLELVALNFPAFTDGRHFSSARLLRERYKFAGEVRAIGDVLRDQLFYMQRCGFDAYAIRSDKDPFDALKGLSDFSISYQAAVDNDQPLFRRRAAAQTP